MLGSLDFKYDYIVMVVEGEKKKKDFDFITIY